MSINTKNCANNYEQKNFQKSGTFFLVIFSLGVWYEIQKLKIPTGTKSRKNWPILSFNAARKSLENRDFGRHTFIRKLFCRSIRRKLE